MEVNTFEGENNLLSVIERVMFSEATASDEIVLPPKLRTSHGNR